MRVSESCQPGDAGGPGARPPALAGLPVKRGKEERQATDRIIHQRHLTGIKQVMGELKTGHRTS